MSHESDLPADLEEQFLKHILEFETAEQLTLMQWLENAGLEVPAPGELSDERLTPKLWEIINRMASLGAYLHHTNHLSDRELYVYLYDDALREPTVLFPENPSFVYGIDLLGSGSDEDMQVYMRYFADEEYRQRWAKDFPDFEMPPEKIRRSIATKTFRNRRLDNLECPGIWSAPAERSGDGALDQLLII